MRMGACNWWVWREGRMGNSFVAVAMRASPFTHTALIFFEVISYKWVLTASLTPRQGSLQWGWTISAHRAHVCGSWIALGQGAAHIRQSPRALTAQFQHTHTHTPIHRQRSLSAHNPPLKALPALFCAVPWHGVPCHAVLCCTRRWMMSLPNTNLL